MHTEIIDSLRGAEEQARRPFEGKELLAHPHLIQWQEAHRKFGNNPNRNPPSLQALFKRVLKGGQLPSINSLVDLYNVISLQHTLPVGGEDLDACRGDIQLTIADGSEPFMTIGALENDPPEPGEVIYKDVEGVLCRRFNWREADRTKLTWETRNAILMIEDLSANGETQTALHDLQALIQKFCGGDLQPFLLSKEKPAIELQ